MHDRQQPYPIEVLFEDHVTLSDGRSKPHPVLLQLTSETLIIRRLKTSQVSSINNRNFPTITPRHVLLKRHPTTKSFGFSIKGGSDTGKEKKKHSTFTPYLFFSFFVSTGFPILISRVIYSNAHLLHVGDAILAINNENISQLTHDQVIKKLRDTSGEQVHLIVQFMNEMAPYLRSTTSTVRSSISTGMPIVPQTSFTLPTPSSVRIRRQQNRMSAEYPSGYHRPGKQQQRLSLMLSDQQKVRNSFLGK